MAPSGSPGQHALGVRMEGGGVVVVVPVPVLLVHGPPAVRLTHLHSKRLAAAAADRVKVKKTLSDQVVSQLREIF